ncbi:response regulator transcription factor [Hydrogenophaga sp.]|uniref:response regulator transcription factor n=1 Tax=Hydrogenophaga sp. TaxID=1904254 RepID=UPI003F6C8C38
MDIKIVVADDHPLIRLGLTAQLTQLGYRHIFEAWDQVSLQKAVTTMSGIGLVLLDVVMPGLDGPNWTVLFCEQHSALPVLLFSGLMEGELRARFGHCSNVLGLVSKSRGTNELSTAIDLALAGQTQWTGSAVATQPTPQTATPLPKLTPKQAAVVHLVCLGLTNREIGLELEMQEGTVKNHLKDVFVRLGVTNRTQLALRLR